MIAGKIHKGSGLGNQLFRYVATRCLARDLGLDFGFYGVENYKGADFLKLDFGKPVEGILGEWQEKKVVENGVDIRGYDPEINFVTDNTAIDGEFQDDRYFSHHIVDILGWLKTEYLLVPDDVCIINFRGGEYVGVADLFLTKEYWDEAIKTMRDINPSFKFEVHTDDIETAKKFFPDDFSFIANMGLNWRSIRHAKYLILSNSSFAIIPALLNENAKFIIAPRYWARRNTKVWALPSNYYSKFFYI